MDRQLRYLQSSTPPPLPMRNEQTRCTCAACWTSTIAEHGRAPIDEVESVDSIVKRFKTAAMSLRRHCPRRPTRLHGYRHEPSGRQVQHRRGRREPRTASGTEEQQPLLCHQAGGIRPLRRDQPVIWSPPVRSRSRWRRARSPARAASCPAARSTRGSPRPVNSTTGVGLISPAAPPRYLLHRGPGAADLRLEVLQHARQAINCQARQRGRCRHRSPPALPRPVRRSSWYPALTAAPAQPPATPSTTQDCRGSLAWPRHTRP